MSENKPRIRKIKEIREESPTVKSFVVRDVPSAKAVPGQFIMVWVPDSGEIPLAVSRVNGERIEFTVRERGETTARLHEFPVGEKVGIRGPYGNGFSEPEGKTLIVGGGYGIAPLRYFYERAAEASFTVLEGASTADELLFTEDLEPEVVSTDDGSRGHEGNITEPLEELLEAGDFEGLYAAGPEPMLYEVFLLCREMDIYMEASLERMMKCGVGLCGSCLIDGFRVCQEGPVANSDKLAELDEFGAWERTASGKRKKI